MQARSDEEMVLAVRGGDRGAFDVLARAHLPRLVGAARAILRDAADAEDAVADALLKIHDGLPRLRDARAFPAWAHAIVCRTAIDRLRRRRAGAVPSALFEEPCDPRSSRGPSERLEAEERLDAVRRAVDRLPQAQRLAVVLHVWEGLDYDRVAELLGSSYDAVRVNVAHARRALAASLSLPSLRRPAERRPAEPRR